MTGPTSSGEIVVDNEDPGFSTDNSTVMSPLKRILGVKKRQADTVQVDISLAVIGGLFSSTILTLIVIPCVYWVVDSFGDLLTGRKKMNSQMNNKA